MILKNFNNAATSVTAKSLTDSPNIKSVKTYEDKNASCKGYGYTTINSGGSYEDEENKVVSYRDGMKVCTETTLKSASEVYGSSTVIFAGTYSF